MKLQEKKERLKKKRRRSCLRQMDGSIVCYGDGGNIMNVTMNRMLENDLGLVEAAEKRPVKMHSRLEAGANLTAPDDADAGRGCRCDGALRPEKLRQYRFRS